jgi:hypothetical protein
MVTPIVVGEHYLLTFTTSGFTGTSTTLTVSIGGVTFDAIKQADINGVISFRFRAINTNALTFTPSATGLRVDLDNVSLKKITAGDLYVANNLNVGSLTATRVPFVGTAGLLQDDADMTFSGTRLTVTDLTSTNAPIVSSLTAGRVVFAGASKQLVDDADMTFATDTLTVTKIKSSHYCADGTAPLANGTYTIFDGSYTGAVNGTITIKDGLITAYQAGGAPLA